jgi:RNA polymerase sigma-70 factor (ECF subfamily)
MRINRWKDKKSMEFAREAQWSSSLHHEDDVTLVQAAKTQPEALEELFDRYYDKVYRYAYYRLHNRCEAEDIASLVFVRVVEGLQHFQPDRGQFVSWLFRIAHNALVDLYRRQRITLTIEQVDDEHVIDTNADNHLVQTLEHESILRGLEELTDEQREVIVMRYVADLSYPEIAEALGKSQSTIRMTVHRALRRLRELCEGEV